jgi:hypothetical protein
MAMRAIVKSLVSFGSFILLGASQNAVAQEFSNFGFSMPDVTWDYAGQRVALQQANQLNQSMLNSASSEPSGKAAPPEVKSPVTSLNFSISSSVRSRSLESFAAKIRAADPANAENFLATYGSVDVIRSFGKAMAPFGLRVDNAADTFALWWIAAWQTANRDTRHVDAKTYKAVSLQAAKSFANHPQFASITDAMKQEFSESSMIQTLLIGIATDRYGSDPGYAQSLADAVRQGTKATGLDLDVMTLTEDGFVPAKGK